jgi:2-polyprenyl-3-methyl-5-hydroxy-6-metoxy-1,4-benzoquinol methylase
LETFKEQFYQDYFSNQAVRTIQSDVTVQHVMNCRYYEQEILPLLPSDKTIRIVELGAGYGSFLKFLKENKYTNCSGIDVSKEQTEVAKKWGIEIIQTDIISYLNENFTADVIVLIDVLEHFTRSEALDILKTCKSKLKAGGSVIFRCPNTDAPMGTVYANGDLTHDLFLNKSSALQLALAAGFANPTVHPSYLYTKGVLKNSIRKMSWFFLRLKLRWMLFATGRSASNVLFTPNLIVLCKA